MISHEIHCAINATIVAVVLNLVLPLLVKHIATLKKLNQRMVQKVFPSRDNLFI